MMATKTRCFLKIISMGGFDMKDKFNDYYPAEDAFLTNPIASATEATGCSLRIQKIDDHTVSLSAPVKGTETEAIAEIKKHRR